MVDHGSVDGTGMITVHVPIAFAQRGGRKTVATPDGSPPQTRRPRGQADTALVKALARAFRWRKLIETGAYATMQEIAEGEGVTASYVGRILRLTLLAPDIVEGILDGKIDRGVTLDALMKPFPMEWACQRTHSKGDRWRQRPCTCPRRQTSVSP